MGKTTATTQTKDTKTEDKTGAAANTTLLGSDVLESVIDINGTQVQLGEVVQAAFTHSALSVEGWNAQESAEREQRIAEALEIMRAATVGATDKKSGGTNKKVKMLRIRSTSKDGFRRAGMKFTQEAFEIAVDDLSEEQLAAIMGEPRLSVEQYTA